MRKFRIPLIAICFMLFAIGGYATDLFSVGKSADNNLYKITDTAIVEGQRGSYEVFTGAVATTNTLTAIESGKTIISVFSEGEDLFYNLPSASVGLVYTFTSGGGTANYIYINPVDADSIIYADPVLSEGDRLKSNAATGDSVTLICGAANSWYVGSMNGTWTDAN